LLSNQVTALQNHNAQFPKEMAEEKGSILLLLSMVLP
jgi:hypothetical protein